MKTRFAIISTFVASALLGAGCQGPLVGGDCLDGYVKRDGACVAASERGASGGGDDLAGGSGGAGPDTSSGPSDVGSGAAPPASTGSAGSTGSSGVGCEAGDVACGASCVDLETDPGNCGACGVACPSGLCEGGRCEGAYAGHVVLCGFDQRALGAIAPARIAGNAIFAWPVDPVRVGVLSAARAMSRVSLSAAVASEADQRGRAASVEWLASAPSMGERLGAGTLDVAVIGALPPDAGDAADVGERLADGIAALTARGGVFILLARGDHAAISSFAAAARIAEDLVVTDAASGPVDVVAFDDLLTVGVPTPFAQPASSLSFLSPAFAGRAVIADESGRALVLQGGVAPPADSP